MDNNREFFEKLAGVAEENKEFEAQLARASKVSKKVEEEPIITERENILTAKSDDFNFDDSEGHLTIDVYQNSDEIIVESTIAGIGTNDIDVAITPESVTIKGKREKKEKVRKDDYLYQECFWGKFSRSIILPQEIDPDKSQASLKDGVLKIVLPKVQRQKSKKVRVKLD